MTLPNRPDNPAQADNTTIETKTVPVVDELVSITQADYGHADYDRHPLAVRGLAHYIESEISDERFHIS